MGNRRKEYERLRLSAGQHQRILLVALAAMVAFVPVMGRLYDFISR